MSSNALEKLRRRSAAVRIQSNIRRRQHHKWTVQLAYNTWEKLIDHKQSAFFYYNHTSGVTQWFKPLLLKKKLLEPNADFNYHETDAYKNQRYKGKQKQKNWKRK